MDILFIAVPASLIVGMIAWEIASCYYLNRIKKAQKIIEDAKKVKGIELNVHYKYTSLPERYTLYEYYDREVERIYLSYNHGGKSYGLVGYEQYKELEDKFNLLTEHLKLEYVEQKETTEPPKFQEIK